MCFIIILVTLTHSSNWGHFHQINFPISDNVLADLGVSGENRPGICRDMISHHPKWRKSSHPATVLSKNDRKFQWPNTQLLQLEFGSKVAIFLMLATWLLAFHLEFGYPKKKKLPNWWIHGIICEVLEVPFRPFEGAIVDPGPSGNIRGQQKSNLYKFECPSHSSIHWSMVYLSICLSPTPRPFLPTQLNR